MEPLSDATREILWNISHVWVLYALFAAALGVLAFAAYQRIEFWRRGKPHPDRSSDLLPRLASMVREVFAQRKVVQKRFPGWIHLLLFYSFLVLVVTTSVIAVDHDFGTDLFRGYLYVVLTVGCEIGGLLVLLGVVVALWRRHVRRPVTLDAPPGDTWAFGLMALIVVSGFVVEGLRIAVAGDPWRSLSFVGYGISPLFAGLGADSGKTVHWAAWWLHAGLVFAWIAVILNSKFAHLFLIPVNALFAKRRPAGELPLVDLDALLESEDVDEDFNIGLDTTRDLTWKQRLDIDACVACGRCEEMCPPLQAGQALSPKKLILGMKGLAFDRPEGESADDGKEEIVGNAFDEKFVWYCLTCLACTQACPAYISHVDTLVEVRRNEVSMKGRADADVSRTIRLMEAQGNPFGTQITRGSWVKSLDVPVLDEGGECDVLYWVGCLTTFDEEKQKIARDLIGILRRLGVDFRLLGKAETCCGDPARVCGSENLFQEVAKSEVEALNKRRFNKILVSCPHCYNTLKNEYPKFGGHYEVVHHSEYLHEMIRSGRLNAAPAGDGPTVYHDPCYLGRYQGIYDAPREVIRAASGTDFVELERRRERSFCCGGGGGHFWMETKEGKRIDTMRIGQVKDAGASRVVTSCPYCFHMLNDAVKTMNLEKDIRVVDIVSHVAPRPAGGVLE